jgi:integrating conjugative element relaxase (TIGR03760 family)
MRTSLTARLSTFLKERPPAEPPASNPCTPLSLPLPSGALPILSIRELLRHRRDFIAHIEELAGTTCAHFERYYLADLARFAAWVQQLPASEAHHHAYPGGLLDHTCEVAVAALRIRRGYLLPPGAPPEEAVLKKDLWTYAVFTLTLLHDAAKPAVDQIVTIHGADHTSWPWNPWAGSLGDDPRAIGYEVAFRRQRDYQAHQQASLLLASRLCSPEGLAWLASDPDVFGAWLAYAAGDVPRAGVFADFLAKADSESVARSLGAAGAGSCATAHRASVPLHDKVLTALRHLIETGDLPLNRRGAAGWRSGDDLWLLSKRVPDALRAHLLAEGQAGIPSDNPRLFNVLQDHGLLVPNAEGKAVWRMTVHAEDHVDTLSLLRIPVSRLWADPEAAPPEFAGAVEPGSPPPGQDDTSPQPAPAVGIDDPAAPAAETPLSEPNLSMPVPVVRPPRPRPTTEPIEIPAESSAPPPPATVGRHFMDWLTTALREGRLEYNSSGARVHVVPEGVLLASPGIFRDFAEATHTEFESVQRSFQKLKLHKVTTAGHNIHDYAVSGSGAVIKGFLLPDTRRVFGEVVPNPNPYLSRH